MTVTPITDAAEAHGPEKALSAPEARMLFDNQLYHLSGLVDAVRDTAHALFEAARHHSVNAAAKAQVIRYNRARTELINLFEDHETVDRIRTWTDELDESATVMTIFDAAATLARIVDLTLQADRFVAGRIQERLEIDSVLEQAKDAYPESADDPAPARVHDRERQAPGQYL